MDAPPTPGSPRYLRLARRKAARMGLNPSSGEEAVRMLRERGVDVLDGQPSPPPGAPQEGTTGRNLALSQGGGGAVQPAGPPPDLGSLPGPMERLKEVARIQRELVRRRRLRLFLLFVRLAVFVALPSWIAGYYYFRIATPMYETHSQMVIQQALGAEAAASGAGLLSGGLANAEDSTIVQGYLSSREAMLLLDSEHGFIAHFQQEHIDDIQRLAPDATMEDAYRVYKRHVVISYDPAFGVIKMTVRALDPATAMTFTTALLGYAEQRVDQLSARARDDQMRGAQQGYQDAEQAMRDAQGRVLNLQELRGVLSAEAEISGQMNLINTLTLQVEDRRLALAEINANPRPNVARAEVLSAEIVRLEERIAELRSGMTDGTDTAISLARISGELRIAETELQTRAQMVQTSLQQMENARVEANRQVRYLSLGVSPVQPDVATYPRRTENTLLALVIFFGVYMFVSLTVSVLREQISV